MKERYPMADEVKTRDERESCFSAFSRREEKNRAGR